MPAIGRCSLKFHESRNYSFMVSALIPAPLWRRLIASIYDGLLLLGLWMAAALVDLVLREQILGIPRYWIWMQLYFYGVGLFFFGWFWVRAGQTLGMRAWRLQVRRIDGAPLRPPVAAVRFTVMLMTWGAVLAPALLLIPGFSLPGSTSAGIIVTAMLVLASAIPMLMQGRRRAICDWVAGTEVVVLPAHKK